ncbi:MAG: chromosome segregation protein SMC [Oscillospiraceae bacterium]|nr:chromosome segregation protein SMC [Oscillospiraceae bacterium]
MKSISIQGFKTFPDRVDLSVPDGVTAVVGPNGSGKSNIGEAVRWVLGEQNARVMRCEKKMEEVIFHGSERRGAVGFAEVSLMMGNEDRAFATDTDEVTLTRRLYRSGESEYFINKSAVRLKDITTLLLDTGLGPGGYSIIAQGMIDRIMTEKPADRRGVFEEAAGIAKYRSRKEEAQRKLSAAEQNLLRVSDKIGELEPQVESLREQAETAKRFLLLRDELRSIDINLWLHQIEAIRSGKDRQNDQYREAKERFEQSKAELDALYADMERMERESLDLSQSSETLRETVSELEGKRAEAESGLKLHQNDIEHIERLRQDLLLASEKQDERAETLQKQQDERIAEQNRIEEAIQREEKALSDLAAEAQKLAEQTGDITAQAEALHAKAALSQAALGESKLRGAALEAQRGEQAARRQTLYAEREKDGSALDEARGRLSLVQGKLKEAQGKVEELDNVLKGYTIRVEQRAKKLSEARDKAEELRRALHEKQSRLQLLSDLEKEYEGNHAVAMVMNSKLSGLHGVLSSLIRTNDETAVAIEIALGAALQNIVVSTEEDAKAAISLLKERKGGRATFLPLTTVDGNEALLPMAAEAAGTRDEIVGLASRLVDCDEQYRGVIRNLLGRTIVCRTLDGAIKLSRKDGQRLRIVTLDGQVIQTSGAITGGSVGRKVGILSRKNELERLGDELETLTGKAAEVGKGFEEAERAFKAAQYDLDVAEDERRQAQEDASGLAAEERHRAALMKNMEHAKALCEGELAEIGRRIETIDAERGKETAAIEEHTAAIETLEAEIAALSESHGALDVTGADLRERQSALRERLASFSAEREGIQKAVEELEERKKDLSMDSETRAATLDGYQKQGEDLLARCEERRRDITGLEQAIKQRRGEMDATVERQRLLEGSRVQAGRKAKDGAEQNIALSRAADKLENSLLTTQKEEDALVSRLWEQYELTVTKAQELRTPMESVSKAQRRAAELKREIGTLGNVNLGAIEAYESVGERYRYLTEQRADAQQSKDELDGIIERITGEMRSIFAEQFAKIAQRFSETFVEIFGGGEAALELDDGVDILESGVEIKAQPPGKKLRSISLLSGGEQSLSAIALYFAIFKVRPAPFCVLDEIDHDLDDVNVGRFAAYLKRFAQTAQYIVVTHRRGTMEQAGMLYGVTAQEPGVSKVISLRLDEVEDSYAD